MLPPGVRQSSVARSDGLRDTKSVWELRFAYKASPRPPYLTATDYVFYVKRQTQRENSHHNHRHHQNGGVNCRSVTSSGGDQPVLSPEDAMVELTNFTELMRRLKEDLRSSYSSFVEEFVNEPNDGVTLLLDLLKTYRKNTGVDHGRYASTRARQQHAKKAQSEELDCLQCLFYSLRCQKSLGKIINHGSGLCTIASSIMSSCSKSRNMAIEIASAQISKTAETKNTSAVLSGCGTPNGKANPVNGASHDSDGSSGKEDIDWNYPALPEPRLFRRDSRSYIVDLASYT